MGLLMKRLKYSYLSFLFIFLALGLQGCSFLGTGENCQFQSVKTSNGKQIRISTSQQAVFKGKIYFTLDRNLYMLDGQKNLKQLTSGMDVRDPAVSPDGKWIAFIIRSKYSSDLVYRSTNSHDQTIHTVITGAGN